MYFMLINLNNIGTIYSYNLENKFIDLGLINIAVISKIPIQHF